ncbi:zinc finger protein 40 [Heteronotia binoei]|uniref:zinc finger protein 40 n=1 Tax=Heteronotia binoei TaxID=13085 RepID=UPI00292F8DE1|nr:zinc finger protein 40 [Heteronotia binoei]XP_060100197.1 zinc finger protein 40 [Heteronotia binoei]XP_060100198.1 zinc finger protein 40 [Heteronotia binoei]
MRMPRTKQINPRNLREKIEEAQKELNETEDPQKEISEAASRGSTDAVKGVKRKKIVTENHLTKIPKSPLRTPSRVKPKEKIEDLSSSCNILPDPSELLKEECSSATQNGKQSKQNEGTLSGEVAVKTSRSETSAHARLCRLPQSLDLNKWPVEDYSSSQLSLPVKKSLPSSMSTIPKVDNNECIPFVDCSNSSSCTNTAFDVLLKAMEPELNTLAQECPSSRMQIEKLKPNKTVSASSDLTSNTLSVQSHAALPQQEFVAGSQYYPCTSQTVHVATSGKSEQAQMHSVTHSQEQILSKAGQQNQQITACPGFSNSLIQPQNQENLKLQHIYSIAVTSSIINPPSSTVTQVFSQNPLVAKASPLSIHPSSSATQLPIAPLYSSAQIASVVSHGVEQICNLLKDQKPKKLGKYVCEYCNRACAKPSVLLKHIRSHTGERPYPCETCGFSFKTKSNLYKHKKSHAHAIKLGLVLQPDSTGLFLSHESDKALSIHSDVEESGDSDDEGTADERQEDQGSLELEHAHVMKILSNSESSLKSSSVSLSNPEYMGDSPLQDPFTQGRTSLPKVIVHPVNVSPLRSNSPKVADPTSTVCTTRQGDFKASNVKPNVVHADLVKESDIKQHQKTETSISEEQHGTPAGTVVHAQLQRQQATDCSQDQQGKCLLSPRSLGSTDSGYFSRSESADQNMSPPTPFMKGLPTPEKDPSKSLPCVPRVSTTVASFVQTVCPDKNLLSSGQMRPPLATKTLEERISKLISDNQAVVDDKQLDSVKPRRTSLSRRGSIDSPKSYIFKDSFQFDLKPMGRRTSSSSDIPKSPFTPTDKSKQVFLLSVPTLDCLPITRSNSMPTTSYSAVPTNVIPPPHPLRGSQSFDDKIGSLYDDVFVPGPSTPQLQGGHPRTLVRQTAIEDSLVTESHGFGPARSVDESYGCSASNEFVMARSKSFVQGSSVDKTKKSHQGRGTMFECETCRNRYRKLENFENHKKFYCSELHGPKTKAAMRDSEHKTVSNSTQPQILHYRVATSTGIWEQTSQIRKRRKMKSVGDDDDEPQTNDNSSLTKNIESGSQNKPGNTVSVSKHVATVLGSHSISLQKLSQNEPEACGAEEAMETKTLLLGEKQTVAATQEKTELKRQGAGISVIQHTNSLSRPSSFDKSDSFETVSPVSFQDGNTAVKLHSLNTIIVQEERHSPLRASHGHQVLEAPRTQLHEHPVAPHERNAPLTSLRLVRQHNIQVPEILVTAEPDKDHESQCSDLEKTEKFNWPQRSESLSKLPTEKLPPKKKRIRLAEIEHSSAESSFDSTLSRSLSRESSLSRASSFSASFDKDDISKNENASKVEPSTKSLEFLTIPNSSNTLSVPHYREMRRAASEQINCTQPSMEVVDYRSKSFDCGSMSPPRPASFTETSTSKLSPGGGAVGHVPLLERRRGPLVRQISLNIAVEKNQPEIVSSTSFQTAPGTEISTASFQRSQSSGKSEEFSSSSKHPQIYAKTLCEPPSVKSSLSFNLPSNEQALGPGLQHHIPQPSSNQYSQTSLKGPALGTQKSMSMFPGQHSMQEDCFAPKYQLQVKAMCIGQQYPVGLPGTAGKEQSGVALETHTKQNDKTSNPYGPSPLHHIPDHGSGRVYQMAPFVVPVRIHSNIPSYGFSTVAPLPQILVTQDQASQSLSKTNIALVPTLKDQSQLPKSHKDPLRCLPSSQPGPLFENLLPETGSKNSTSLGSLNIIQKVPVVGLFPQQEATASSKRMLSPANSLDIAMEKHQKRVKDESGAASATGALSLHQLNMKAGETHKQKKPVLVRQICTMEPLESFSSDQDVLPHNKNSGINNVSDVMLSPPLSECAQPGISSFTKESSEHSNVPTSETEGSVARKPFEPALVNTQASFLKALENSQERKSPSVVNDSRQPSIQHQAKTGAALSIVNASDIQRLSFPSLKTTTNFTWCYLLKRKPAHLLQSDQKISVYSSWSVSSNNPNPLGLPTKIALSLLNSKQKAGKSSYTQAISTNFRSDVLVYSSKWKNNLLKRALVKQKAARELSNKENSETSTDQDENSLAKSEPRRVKIFDGGYKSNEEYVYVRGRGRGKYICEECGIRCKKPSMLKKHIRTHTDVRPYHCNYCNFSFKTKGNLTKHMKSKAHSKKCMDLGVSVGLIDDQDGEECGEKQRLGYDRSGFDAEDSDVPDDDDNDNEEEDEDSQAESVLSATPSVSASPQHHPSRNISQETSSADEDTRITDCFAGVHTDSMDSLPKALLTKMTVLSSAPSEGSSSGPLGAAIPHEASEGHTRVQETNTKVVPQSPPHHMYVDYPDAEGALGTSGATAVTTAVSKSTTCTRLPSSPVDRSTQTTMVAPSAASPYPELLEQKHQQQTMNAAPPQAHLFSHLPLHSQQQAKTPYGMIPVGGIHVVPAGLATYSTFLPIQAGPVQLSIPAVSVIHRTTSALGDPACAVSGTANRLGVAEVNSVVSCIPIGQINVPGIQNLSAPPLQSLPSLNMETVNILGLTKTNITPQIHPSGLTLNAVGLQVLTANPPSQSTPNPQTHIPGLQILNIALPTLITSASPLAADGQGLTETPASSNKACETHQERGPASFVASNPGQITSAQSPQVAPANQRYKVETLPESASSEYPRCNSSDKLDPEKPDSESHLKPKCNINSVRVEQASASEPPMKVNSDVLSSSPIRRTVSPDRQALRRKGLPERQNTVEFSDSSSDDEDRLIIAT